MHGYGFGMGFGWLFLFLLVVFVVYLFRKEKDTKNNSAIDILEKRYANGEIDEEEFETKLKKLDR